LEPKLNVDGAAVVAGVDDVEVVAVEPNPKPPNAGALVED
jgi:hypothetical protein